MFHYLNKARGTKGGFTLIEILLVVAIIAILAGIVILAINPARQIGKSQNAQRKADVNTILNAIYQYALDNNGTVPTSVPAGSNCEGEETYRICITGGTCTSLVDLSVLTNSGTYLTSIPLNPGLATGNITGYNVIQDTNGRVTVCAPDAWNDETISATR